MKKFSLTTKANSRRIWQNKYISQLILMGIVGLFLMWLAPRAMYVTAALVMTPINVVKTWLAESSSSLPQYLRNRSVLIEQMKALEQQIADGGGDHFTAEMLAKENDELRSLLGYVGDERILAGVIGRPSALPYDMLMIDKGERDGIVVGAPAYIGDRTVIGYVQSITSKTALVTLITTPDFVSTVYVLGPDIFTNAVGLGGGQLKVGIPQGIKVKEGDLVILPSINSGVYGSVSYIETVPTQPEQYAYVAPKTAISSLRLISIGTTPMLGTNFDAALKNVEAVRNDLFTVSVPPGYFATTTRVTSTPEAVVDRKVIP